MTRHLSRRRLLALGLAAPLAGIACSDSELILPTPTSPPEPTIPPPPPTPEPSPTPVPPSLQLLPPQIEQGGMAVVVLNEPATSATVTFRSRQYPMLRQERYWWTILGVGASAAAGQSPVAVAYVPAGRSQAENLYASLTVAAKNWPVYEVFLDSTTAALLAPDIVNAEIRLREQIFAGFTTQRLWSGPFARPGHGQITSHYGEFRSYNRAPATDYHKGTDFGGETGAPVMAAAAGRVVFRGELRVRGNAVIIDHGAGVFTAYHHLSAFNVEQGASVTPGQPIGAIGATGLVTGPHLHWEVIVRGIEVDGEPWLAGREIGPA